MGESGEDEIAEPPADPGEPDADHARLAAIVDAWAAAIVTNDAERIADFMADEWVIVSESGITDREAFLGYVKSGDLTHAAMRAVTPPRIRVHGDTATITARITNTAHYGGRRFDADEWTTDVFVRRDGRWRCVLSHITPAAAPPPAA
ncbi:nuclear transport factor 2 family protein [Streptomyces sp. TRM75563]|uniref:nuclear transport factor 2 family protein n=1 Tax=Streptomyces sp. TRM75563 TaxID=2817418 RepID=UPI001F5FFC5B|nr:nuclear transport factor 2 family protein [Streptomyces sp. TRM75563]MCI4042135.1 nuclear transport factor 2 family protein [Streptomyces sp. TRM75563]